MRRLLLVLFGSGLIFQAHAFPCYITMVKDSCWSNYNVSVDVIDVATEKLIDTLLLPKGTSWVRREMTCLPKQTVMLKATFSPVFWESDVGKVFSGQRYWSFPEINKASVSALGMTICYATDFAEVPLPPDASGHCICDTSNIPAMKQP